MINTQQVVTRVKSIPLARTLLKALYHQHFATASGWQRMFYGVYSTFPEAIAAAPKTKGIGYDNPESAQMYSGNYRIINPSDYPVLFWLKNILPRTKLLFDLGGNVGISFYSYKKYLEYPPHLTWLVYDVPEVVKEGQVIASKESSVGLSFTTQMSELDGAEVLLANGSLQYFEQPLAVYLSKFQTKPLHLIINKTPIRDGAQFVTLQTLGTAFCPYYIFNREDFISSILELGYMLVDSWHNAELSCSIPLHPEHRVPSYSGLYFRKC